MEIVVAFFGGGIGGLLVLGIAHKIVQRLQARIDRLEAVVADLQPAGLEALRARIESLPSTIAAIESLEKRARKSEVVARDARAICGIHRCRSRAKPNCKAQSCAQHCHDLCVYCG